MLTDADLTGASVTGTVFESTTSGGFTAAQLYSTANYQQKDLRRINLADNDLTGWDFHGQNLTYADLSSAVLENVDLTEANLNSADLGQAMLTNANLSGAVIAGAEFRLATPRGFMAAQLYSTASYQQKELEGIRLRDNDLSGWDFSGQNLTGVSLASSTLTNANLSDTNLAGATLAEATLTNANLAGATLKNTYLASITDLNSAFFSLETTYNQWTVFPNSFDPRPAGLTLETSATGDFDASDALDVTDVDWLSAMIRLGPRAPIPWWIPDEVFDLSSDSVIDQEDRRLWVKDLASTWFGDANLDGEFNSSDIVQVFQGGEYETPSIPDVDWNDKFKTRVSWSEGDWNGDGVFDSLDFVLAFEDGGYEQGPRTDVVAVPEPGSVALILAGVCLLLSSVHSFRRRPLLVLLAFLCMSTTATHADIYRWDNGALIPGSEGIEPGPGVNLSSSWWWATPQGPWNTDEQNLRNANFAGKDLSHSNFSRSWLEIADFSEANLSDAHFNSSVLANVNLADALITGASFGETTPGGFTKEQLYSTASYQANNLQWIDLSENDLSGWDFSGQDLTNAHLAFSTLANAHLADALITGASFGETTPGGFTKEQLYSTASYQEKNLQGISLASNDLSGWDFSGQDVRGASFGSSNFSERQLYSTASYQQKDLRRIYLGGNNLLGWDFSGQNLTDASLSSSTLTDANLMGAVVTGTRFNRAAGLMKEQLYSTASYQDMNLEGIGLSNNDLTDWDLSGQNLTHVDLRGSELRGTDFTGAVVRGAQFVDSGGLTKEQFYSTASYQAKDLEGIVLADQNLTGWDFGGQQSRQQQLWRFAISRGQSERGRSHSRDVDGRNSETCRFNACKTHQRLPGRRVADRRQSDGCRPPWCISEKHSGCGVGNDRRRNAVQPMDSLSRGF